MMTDLSNMVLLHKQGAVYTHKPDIDCECSPRLVTWAEAQKVMASGGMGYVTVNGDDGA